jgi:hypothetical protein
MSSKLSLTINLTLNINKYFMSAVAMESFAFNYHPAAGPALRRRINPTRPRQYIVLGAVVLGSFVTYFLGGSLPYITLFNKITDPWILPCYPDGQVFTIIMKAVCAMFLFATAPLLLFSGRIYLAPLVALLAVRALIAVLVTHIDTMFKPVGGVAVPTIL